MASEITTPLLIQLAPAEREALSVIRRDMPPGVSEAQAVRALLKDHLIGLGVLALERRHRSKHAG
jgi:hypothetical protein